MSMNKFFKAVVEADVMPIVLCNLDHTIIYMNRAALASYANRGGAGLIGRSIMDCHAPRSCELIEAALAWFSQSVDNNVVFETHSEAKNIDYYTVALRDDEGELIGYYEKQVCRNAETGKPYESLGLAGA